MNAAICGQRRKCRHSPGAGGMEAGSPDPELRCRWRLTGRGGEGLRVNEKTSLTHSEGSRRGAVWVGLGVVVVTIHFPCRLGMDGSERFRDLLPCTGRDGLEV